MKQLLKKTSIKRLFSIALCVVMCLTLLPSITVQATTTKLNERDYETDWLVTGTSKVGQTIETNLELYAEKMLDDEKTDFWAEQFFNITVDESGGFGKWLYTPKGSSKETVLSDAFDQYGYSKLTLKEEWAGGTIRVRYVFDDVTLYSKPITVIGNSTTPVKPVDPDPVVPDPMIEAKDSGVNEIQFGKTYKGESTGWLYGNPAQYSFYQFSASNLPKDSVVRVKVESSNTVKLRFGDKDAYKFDTTYYEINPLDIAWGKKSGALNIFIHAKSDWKVTFYREDFDYGKVNVTWDKKDLVNGKILNDKSVHFTLDYKPGSNFGVANTGFYILSDEAVKNGWVLRNGENGNQYKYTYKANKIGQDILTIHYGDRNINTTLNIPINVCPPKPEKPSTISGTSKSITLNHLSTTKKWKAEIYKGGKWVSAGSTTGKVIKVKGLKAKTAYKFRIYDVLPASNGVPELCSPVSSVFTVKTAPTAKPVIKSVEISDVKQNYHESQYNPGQWVGNVYNAPSRTQPYWTTSFKVTITMKNKIKGSSSRFVKMKMKKGRVITQVLKGNKTKYTFVVSLMGKYTSSEISGKSTTVAAATDSKGLVVGPTSKAVKSK